MESRDYQKSGGRKEEKQGEFAEKLLNWFGKNGRSLPWRGKKNAYYTWLSEIMLQQTRVEAVKGYFHRFIERFPDIASLALAKEEEVLKLWEGLGYYSRARNLHKGAKLIMEQYDGKMPSAYPEIRSIPGIGDYTAAAISSIVFSEKIPAVDGNFLIRQGEKIVLKKRPKKGVLAGLYGFYQLSGFLTKKEALEEVQKLGFIPLKLRELGKARHIFTHKEWEMIGYEVLCGEFPLCKELREEAELFTKEEIESELSIPSAFSYYKEFI